VLEEAVALHSLGHHQHAGNLMNLANGFLARFQLLVEREALDCTFRQCKEALDCCSNALQAHMHH
jgi:hypothetical protein